MATRNYKDLPAWQKAMDLAVAVHKATKSFPKEEAHGLTGQIRAAAISIPSNIAEGQGRGAVKLHLQHLSAAHGALRELETQLLIAGRLGYTPEERLRRLMELAAETGRLINGLSHSLVQR